MGLNSGACLSNPPLSDFLIAFSSINKSMGKVPNRLLARSAKDKISNLLLSYL